MKNKRDVSVELARIFACLIVLGFTTVFPCIKMMYVTLTEYLSPVYLQMGWPSSG